MLTTQQTCRLWAFVIISEVDGKSCPGNYEHKRCIFFRNCTLKKTPHISLENDLSRMTEVTDRVKACVSDMGFLFTLKQL